MFVLFVQNQFPLQVREIKKLCDFFFNGIMAVKFAKISKISCRLPISSILRSSNGKSNFLIEISAEVTEVLHIENWQKAED